MSKDPRRKRRGFRRMPFLPTASSGASWHHFVMDISRTGGLTMRTPKAWGQPCPHPDCAYAQMINRGNIRAISSYLTQSGKRRIFQCTTCGIPFSETRDTVFFDLKTPEENVRFALYMLLFMVYLVGF